MENVINFLNPESIQYRTRPSRTIQSEITSPRTRANNAISIRRRERFDNIEIETTTISFN